MKNKGFTLIELLAVIVILAIIALIATPIILNIINDSKEESNKRSIDMYGKAIANAVAADQLDGTVGLVGTFNTTTLEEKLNIEYDGETVVCDTIKITEDGSVYLADCSINGKSINYQYGTNKDNGENQPKICKLAQNGDVDASGTITMGDKYECEVEVGKTPYTFYVLTTPAETDEKVNLILNRNINSDGTLAEKALTYAKRENGVYSTLQWVNATDFNNSGGNWNDDETRINYGPVTAMNFLNEATKNWRDELTLNETENYNTPLQITGKARLPRGSEVANYSATTAFLYDYLDGAGGKTTVGSVPDMLGYWLTNGKYSSRDEECQGRYVYSYGDVRYTYIADDDLGVRPVISVPISMMSK